jgi:ariadne-1
VLEQLIGWSYIAAACFVADIALFPSEVLTFCLCFLFCLTGWLCGAATGKAHSWTTIDGHKCGSYKDQLKRNASDARLDLERYMHYFSRYNAHMESLKVAAVLKSKVNQTKDALEDLGEKNTAMTASMPTADWLTIGLEQ